VEDDEEDDEESQHVKVESLTDRKLSAGLFNRISSNPLNMQVGKPLIIRGPPGSPILSPRS